MGLLSRWVSGTGRPQHALGSPERLRLGSDTLSLPTEAKRGRDHEGWHQV